MDPKEKAKRYSLLKNYGITLEERIKMGNKCEICFKSDGRLNVDHRHIAGYKKLSQDEKKKEVRGILCFMCNVMISKLERRKIARFLLGRINEYFRVYKMFGDE